MAGFNNESKNPFPLTEYFNIFSFNDFVIDLGNQKKRAVFELTMREPSPECQWDYFIFFGIKEFIDLVSNWKFDETAIEALNKSGFAKSERQKEFYRNWKPNFNIYSISDGDVFFKGEPILRVEGDMIGVNLLTHLCLSFFQYPIRLATKDVRLRRAGGAKSIFYGGGRSQSRDDIYWLNKLTHPLAKNDIIYPSIFTQYPNLPNLTEGTINLNHAFIKSFHTEEEAFIFGLDKINDFGVFTIMTDTYDYKKGLDTLIKVIFEKKIHESDAMLAKIYVIIDSGDIFEQSQYVRKVLDKNNLGLVKIIAMSGLDEKDIAELESRECKADAYAVITNLINCYGCAYLDFVFKTSVIIDEDGTEHVKAKLTKGKESLPGRKNISRAVEGGMIIDKIVPEDNSNNSSYLLRPVMLQGKPVLPDEESMLKDYNLKLAELSKNIGSNNQIPHSVEVDERIKDQIINLRSQHGTT